MAELQSTCCLEGEGCSSITSSQGALPGKAAPPNVLPPARAGFLEPTRVQRAEPPCRGHGVPSACKSSRAGKRNVARLISYPLFFLARRLGESGLSTALLFPCMQS